MHINEDTGQYKCHGGCDSQAVYTAAWELAESRGWQPPKKAIFDGLSKIQAIALLAKNSPKAQKLSEDDGSAPAYNYVSMGVKAAQQQSV